MGASWLLPVDASVDSANRACWAACACCRGAGRASSLAALPAYLVPTSLPAGTISKELVLLSRQDILLGGNRLSGQLPQTLSNPDLERLDLRCGCCCLIVCIAPVAGWRPTCWAAWRIGPVAGAEGDLSSHPTGLVLKSAWLRSSAAKPPCPAPVCSFNQFTGLLPPAWGDKTALPNLARLGLQGNLLRGPVPGALAGVDENRLCSDSATPCRRGAML